MALTAYLPILNTEYHGSSSRNAGILTAMYSIGASLSRVASGRLVDRFGGGKCSMYGQACILFGSVILAMSPPNNMYSMNQFVGIAFMAFGAGFTNSAVYKWIAKVEPKGKA